MADTAEQVFFSRSESLVMHVNCGTQIMQGGQIGRVGEKIIEFYPNGDGYGRLATNDPEVIAFLHKRAAVEQDVYDLAEYTRRVIPPEVQLTLLQTEHARVVEERNELLARLQAEGRLPSQSKGQK